MYLKVHACNDTIPANHTLDFYTGVYPTTCSFCDALCQVPNITSEINFFDGFNGKAVLITYIVIIIVSIIFEILR